MSLLTTVIIFITLLLVWFVYRCNKANLTDWGGVAINFIDGFNRLFCLRFHRLKTAPLALPKEGAAIVVANHISGLDPLLMVAAARRPIRFLIAHEEYHRFGLTWLYRLAGCIPVERDRNPERAFKVALQHLAEGEVVALFPEGGIHTADQPVKRLKTGAVRLSYLAGVPIYPLHIQGIRGEGHVVSAVLMRSRAILYQHLPIVCEKHENKECLEHIKQLIQQPVSKGSQGQ